jgi:hypothetical protein
MPSKTAHTVQNTSQTTPFLHLSRRFAQTDQSHTPPPLAHSHTHTHTHTHTLTRTTTGRCSVLGLHHGAARLCAFARQQVRHEVHCVSPSRQDAPCLLALRAHPAYHDLTYTSQKKLTRTHPPTHPHPSTPLHSSTAAEAPDASRDCRRTLGSQSLSSEELAFASHLTPCLRNRAAV